MAEEEIARVVAAHRAARRNQLFAVAHFGNQFVNDVAEPTLVQVDALVVIAGSETPSLGVDAVAANQMKFT